ncbi:MAG: arsenate reductase ArsC, partial [Caldilineaceae bacterium]|nr:arsenate reductase ArsC [Caldilineaceae bacterium]
NLVNERRSSADGRDVYYSLDLACLTALYHESGSQLHPALGKPETIPQDTATDTSQPPVRVLFLCTHNRARSQVAEGLLRHLGGSAVEVFSAGNQPGTVHPHAIRAMAALGIDIRGQRSKHMEEFYGQSFDFVITVCDRVREDCPVFPGNPKRVHWSIPDPLDTTLNTTADDSYVLFEKVAQELRTRITYLLLVMRN